jgi:hypothetical protein
MLAFAIFIISLVLITLLFFMKSLEIYHGRKIFLEKQFENFDNWIHRLVLKIEYWWSHVNFVNTKRVMLWVAKKTHKFAIVVKRRFDHEQSHFFTRKEVNINRAKRDPSFFLKDVSEYKKKLRDASDNK